VLPKNQAKYDQIKYNYDGSISIFYALIFVCLITFIFSLVDITRRHMLQLEALSNFKVAGETALSQYEPLLLKQYGLFAGEKSPTVDDVIGEALKTSYSMDTSKQNTFFIDYILENQDEQSDGEFDNNDKSNFMRPIDFHYNIEYIPFLDTTFKFPKQQILTYMKIREPYLLAQPFLEKLDFITKTSKTSQVIEEKNNLVSQLKCLDSYQQQLMLLIDGITITKDGQAVIGSADTYIRRYIYPTIQDSNVLNALNPYYSDELKNSNLLSIISFSQQLDQITTLLSNSEALILTLINTDPYEPIYITPIGDEEPIYLGDKLTDDAANTLQELKSLEESYIESQRFLSEIEALLARHTEALSVIEEIERVSQQSYLDISAFQSHKMNKNELIESAYDEINTELETVKSSISMDKINLSAVDNLGLIKEKLESNNELLNAIVPHIHSLSKYLSNYHQLRFETLQATATYSQEKKDKISKLLKNDLSLNDSIEPENVASEKTIIDNLVQLIDKELCNYDEAIYLDYRNAVVSPQQKTDYESKGSSLKELNLLNFFETKGIVSQTPMNVIDAGTLPSALLSNLSEITLTTESATKSATESTNEDTTKSTNESANELSSDDSILSLISNGIKSTHETLLLNEYAIGMFSDFEESNALNSKSMNGYSLKEHFFSYETEYILGGSLNEKENLSRVLGYIYGVRMSCNLIFLAIDTQKRTTIMNLANTIAGWWTGGVGGILIGILIAAFWALMESIIDVFLLTSGERVPMIKTPSTWYSSLEGNWEELLIVGVKRLENEVTKAITHTNSTVHEAIIKIQTSIQEQIHQQDEDNQHSLDRMNDELSYFESTLNEITEETSVQIEALDMAFVSQMDTFINTLIQQQLNIRQHNLNTTEYQESWVDNPFKEGTQPYTLAETIRQDILKKSEEAFLDDISMTKQVDLRSSIEKTYGKEMLDAKNELQEELINELNRTIETSLSQVEQMFEKSLEEGNNISKDLLHSKADELRKTIRSKQSESLPTKTKEISYVPSFSYADYLRLFLLLPLVDETTKVARMMDLVQLNIQKNKDDYDITLKNYWVGFNLSGDIDITTYFVPTLRQGALKHQDRLDIKPFEVKYDD